MNGCSGYGQLLTCYESIRLKEQQDASRTKQRNKTAAAAQATEAAPQQGAVSCHLRHFFSVTINVNRTRLRPSIVKLGYLRYPLFHPSTGECVYSTEFHSHPFGFCVSSELQAPPPAAPSPPFSLLPLPLPVYFRHCDHAIGATSVFVSPRRNSSVHACICENNY